MNKKLLKLAPVFIFVFSFFITSTGLAQGDLMIMPKRLVFDGSQRSQEISLANTGSDSATYAISFVQYNMTESGSFEEVTEPVEGQRFADEFLRFYPRRVVLGPNEAQTVRVQVTRTGNLEPGEYRSHIYFRAVEEQTALGSEDTSEAQESISIQINTVFGISIPVIIRHGESTTSVEIAELDLDMSEDVPLLSMALIRSGNISTYGDITITHVSPAGVATEVGKVKGIAVYTPNARRNFALQLNPGEETDLSNGSLEISYSEEGGKVLGQTSLKIN